MKDLALSSDYETMLKGSIHGGISYLQENPGIISLIIGISGGVDSAVVAALSRQIVNHMAATADREIKICGYSLSILSNKPDEIKRARAVGETYCDEFVEESLSETFMGMLRGVDPLLYTKYVECVNGNTLTNAEKVRLGNIKARIRMIYLYNKAQERGGLVLSTDNLTEYNLGFWTLHGDVGDFGLIQNLWKTEVYGMGDVIGGPVTDCVRAIPTDGLGITNSDIDQLIPDWTSERGDHRAAYKIIDETLIDHLSELGTFSSDNPVIQRYKTTHFKRKNPINIKRDMLLWHFNSL
jgi:nicotinamide-nucleotide amidase